MNIPNMIVTVCLFYKMFFTLGTLDLLVSPVYMHVTLGYILKMSITVFALHLAILAISFQCHWILGYLILSHNWLGCECGVFEVHVIQKHLLIYQILLTHLALLCSESKCLSKSQGNMNDLVHILHCLNSALWYLVM